MAHWLEITNGEARFAFNKHNGDPWHRLGTPVDGCGSLDEMLVAAQANWEVALRPLFIQGADGSPIEVEDRRATVREEITFDEDGVNIDLTPLGVVSPHYAIEQNRSAAEWALELVGASGGDAVIDTMGVLRNGKELFIGVDLGTLVLDPDGIADAVKRYLIVRNSHDGTSALLAYPTNTRVVCWNTATMSFNAANRARQVHKVRHTSSIDDRKAQAVEAMGLAKTLGEMFAEQAFKMMGISGGHDVLDKVLTQVWAKPDPAQVTERVMNGWFDRREAIHAVYDSDTCVGGFGDSGWTVWNSITEYLDHGNRPRTTADSRALASMDIDGAVAKAKDRAAQAVLALV